jgi:hypothetical protein
MCARVLATAGLILITATLALAQGGNVGHAPEPTPDTEAPDVLHGIFSGIFFEGAFATNGLDSSDFQEVVLSGIASLKDPRGFIDALKGGRKEISPSTSSFALTTQTGQGAGSASEIAIGVVGTASFGSDDFGKTWRASGGLQVAYLLNPKVALFGRLSGGVRHFTDETDLQIEPDFGVYVPVGRRLLVTGELGFPIIFFPGNAERGLQVAGGIAVPIGH